MCKLSPVTKKVPEIQVTTEWRLEAAFKEVFNLSMLLFQVQHRLGKHLIGTVWCIDIVQLGYLYSHIAPTESVKLFVWHNSHIKSIMTLPFLSVTMPRCLKDKKILYNFYHWTICGLCKHKLSAWRPTKNNSEHVYENNTHLFVEFKCLQQWIYWTLINTTTTTFNFYLAGLHFFWSYYTHSRRTGPMLSVVPFGWRCRFKLSTNSSNI